MISNSSVEQTAAGSMLCSSGAYLLRCRPLCPLTHMVSLFKVADRFQIEGIGCVLVPGLSCEPGDPVVRLGHRIRLLMPSGSHLDTTVRGIEHIRYAKMPKKITYPVLLPENITRDDVPVGTEVLLLEHQYETVQSH